MPATEYYVNQSTSVVFTGGNSIVYLSSSPLLGTIITIRDISGTTNNLAPITVSTTQGILFQENKSTFQLFQPYSFLTVSPKNISTWNLLNSFGFPQEGSALSVSSFTTETFDNTVAHISSAFISTMQINTLFANSSTIVNNGFFSNTTEFLSDVRLFNSLSVLKNVYVASTLFAENLLRVGSTLNVVGPSYFFNILSTISTAQIGGNLSTLGNFNLEREALFKSSALYLDNVSINSNLFVARSISTASNLAVGNNLFVKGNTELTGTLSTQSTVLIGQNLSSFGNFSLTREAVLQSSLFVTHSISTTSNLYVKGESLFDGPMVFNNNMSIASNLFVAQSISTASNLAVGNNLFVKGNTELTGTLSTQSSVFIGQNLSTFGTFYLLRNAFFQSSVLFADNVSTSSNLNVRGLLSTISSVSIGDSLNVRSNTILTGNLSTMSSVYFGSDLTLERQARLLSSLTVSGHLSTFSSATVVGDLDVGGRVRAGTFLLPGNAEISTMSIMRGNNFSLINNGSTLFLGLLSTTGPANFTLTNTSTAFARTVHVTNNLSSVGTLDVGSLTTLSNVTVNGTTTFNNNLTVETGKTTSLKGPVILNTGSGTFSITGNTEFNSNVNITGTNTLTVNASTVTTTLNVLSNITVSTLRTLGDTTFANITTALATFSSATLINANSISTNNLSTTNLNAANLTITNTKGSNISLNTNGTFNYLGVRNDNNTSQSGIGVFNGSTSLILGHDTTGNVTVPSIQGWAGGIGDGNTITRGTTASTFVIQPRGGDLINGGELHTDNILCFKPRFSTIFNATGMVRITTQNGEGYLQAGSNDTDKGSKLNISNIKNSIHCAQFDTINSRLGINKINPVTTLDVNGDTTITGNLSVTGIDTTGITAFNIVGNNKLTIKDIVASGDITAQGNVTAYSDRRFKTDIFSIENALSTVQQLQGVYYTKVSTTTKNIGVIAQDVEKVLPEVVHTDSSPEQMKSVAYANLTAVLIEAVKELSKKVQDLESRLDQK